MEDAKFWTIVGESYRPDSVEQAEALRQALGPLLWFEVIDFQAKLEAFAAAADTPELRVAAFVINGEASDRGFRDFRLGLVGSGQRAYEAALREADSLADFLEGDPVDGFGLDRVAVRVYEEKTGGADFFSRFAQRHPNLKLDPPRTDWQPPDEADLRLRLPELSALYLVSTGDGPSDEPL